MSERVRGLAEGGEDWLEAKGRLWSRDSPRV